MIFANRIFAYGVYRFSWSANTVKLAESRAKIDATYGTEGAQKHQQKGRFECECSFGGELLEEFERGIIEELARDKDFLPFTLATEDFGLVGDRARFLVAWIRGFTSESGSGDVRTYTVELEPDSPVYRGSVLFNSLGKAGQNSIGTRDGITAPLAGQGLELGTLGPGQEAVISYHPVKPPGPSGADLVVSGTIQTNTSNTAWETNAVDRLALPAVDGDQNFEAHLLTIDGDQDEITDTWWRVNFSSVAGEDPTMHALMAITIRDK